MDRERAHDRIPYSVEVKFRTTSSFLFAYSVNLSKGGIFLETDNLLPVGSELTLKLRIGTAGVYDVRGRVSWVRERSDEPGARPPGIGVQFHDLDDAIGSVIDQLVTTFRGLTVLLFCPDTQDRHAIGRMVKSIVSTADVVEVGGTTTAEALLGPEIDVVVCDGDADDNAGLVVLRAAKRRDKKIPVIVLSEDPDRRAHALAIGADEVADNPPTFHDLQDVLLRALGRPSTVS